MKLSKRIIAGILSISMLFSLNRYPFPVYGGVDTTNSTEGIVAVSGEEIVYEEAEVASSVFSIEKVSDSDDYIHISRCDQILLIGTDAVVTDTDALDGELGLGAPVYHSDGNIMITTSVKFR